MKPDKSRSEDCGNPTERLRTREWELNPQPLVHWPLSQPTGPDARPKAGRQQAVKQACFVVEKLFKSVLLYVLYVTQGDFHALYYVQRKISQLKFI